MKGILRFWFIAMCVTSTWASLFGATLSGRVTEDGENMNGGVVAVVDPATLCWAALGLISSDGTYQTDSFADGAYYLYVVPGDDSFAIESYDGGGQTLDNAVLRNYGGVARRDIDLPRTAEIRGRVVVQGTTEPVGVSLIDPLTLSPSGYVALDGLSDDYTLRGVRSGRYLLGVVANPDPNYANRTPSVFYPGVTSVADAALVTVEEGQILYDVNMIADFSEMGVLDLRLSQGTDANPRLTLFGNSLAYTANFVDGSLRLILPAANYQVNVAFSNTWLAIAEGGARTVRAGQTTNVVLSPSRGGSITGQISNPSGLLSVNVPTVSAVSAATLQVVAQTAVNFDGNGPYPYEISGLPSGDYFVRFSDEGTLSNAASGFTPLRRDYYPGAPTLLTGQTVSVTSGRTTRSINFIIGVGGALSGQITLNGRAVNYDGLSVTAIDVQSGEVVNGFDSAVDESGQYVIEGLPEGSYKVAVNPGYTEASEFIFGLAGAFSNFLASCGNITPSFYPNASNFEQGTVVSALEGFLVTDVNIALQTGGGISGSVQSQDCASPLKNGLVAAYQNNQLIRIGLVRNGAFEIFGLTSGSYQLRLAPFFADDLANGFLDLNGLRLADLFAQGTAAIRSGGVSVRSGQMTAISPWCVSGLTNVSSVVGPSGADGIRLLYPWISNNAGTFNTTLVVNNYGDEDASVTLTATREDGSSERETRTVPAGGFLEAQADELFTRLGSGSGYSVLLESATTTLAGRWVTNSLAAPSGASPAQGVAVKLDDNGVGRIGETLVFGYLPLSGGAISAPVVVNAGDANTNVTLSFYNASGAKVGETTLRDLRPQRPFARVANELVSVEEDVYMVAESTGQPITGVSFVFDSVFLEPAIGGAVAVDLEAQGSKRLAYPWISNRSGQFESVLVVNNYGDRAADVVLRATRGDGQTSEDVARTIPAGGALQETASTLFPDLGDGSGYTVILEADEATIQGQWVTNNLVAASGGSPSQGVAVDITTPGLDLVNSGRNLMLGYLPVEGAFTAAPVILNLGENTTDVILRYFDVDGNQVAAQTLENLQPGRPSASLADDVVDSSDAVSVIATSDSEPITGVVFVFNGAFNEPAIGGASAVSFRPEN